MQKRAGIARAMALDPEILFFDEPSAGLDPVSAHRLDDLILELRDSLGSTIVVVTHELESAYRIADRITVLDHGQILITGTVDEVRNSDNERVQNLLNRRSEETEVDPDEYIRRLTEEERQAQRAEMQQIILTRLFDRYAAEHSLKAADEEIETWIARMQEAMDADGFHAVNELTPEEAAEFQSMRREMARSLIDHWKLGRALYEQYGGRIIYQQLGPEPLDAYREFLQEQQKAGAFDIEVLEYEADFWDYFINDTMHDFMEEGSEDAASAFEVEPWERLGSSEVSDS